MNFDLEVAYYVPHLTNVYLVFYNMPWGLDALRSLFIQIFKM